VVPPTATPNRKRPSATAPGAAVGAAWRFGACKNKITSRYATWEWRVLFDTDRVATKGIRLDLRNTAARSGTSPCLAGCGLYMNAPSPSTRRAQRICRRHDARLAGRVAECTGATISYQWTAGSTADRRLLPRGCITRATAIRFAQEGGHRGSERRHHADGCRIFGVRHQPAPLPPSDGRSEIAQWKFTTGPSPSTDGRLPPAKCSPPWTMASRRRSLQRSDRRRTQNTAQRFASVSSHKSACLDRRARSAAAAPGLKADRHPD